MQTRPIENRLRRRSITGTRLPVSAVLPVEQDGEDHLMQVRPVILGIAMLAQRLAAGTFKVETGGVHEHQVELAEQVAPLGKQPLFQHILETAWRQCAAVLFGLGQLLAQPGHRPIEMMQVEPCDTIDPIIVPPAVRRPVGAASKQTMQHGQEHRAFERKLVLAFTGEFLDHGAAAGLFP